MFRPRGSISDTNQRQHMCMLPLGKKCNVEGCGKSTPKLFETHWYYYEGRCDLCGAKGMCCRRDKPNRAYGCFGQGCYSQCCRGVDALPPPLNQKVSPVVTRESRQLPLPLTAPSSSQSSTEAEFSRLGLSFSRIRKLPL